MYRNHQVLLRDYSAGKRNSSRAPSLKVKLSDLGNSFQVSESVAYHDDFELQTLSYRAPEVLYGLPFDTQIDMWSLGCLLVEVYIGRRLFDSFNRSSAVATMAKTLGPIPRHRFSDGRFYSALSSLPVYGTLSVDDNGQSSDSAYNQPLVSRLTTLLHCEDPACHTFVSFLAGCLQYDPSNRLSPLAALRHPFISELCPLAHFFSTGASLAIARSSSTTSSVAAATSLLPPAGARTLDAHTCQADSKDVKTRAWLKVEPASPGVVGKMELEMQTDCHVVQAAGDDFMSPSRRARGGEHKGVQQDSNRTKTTRADAQSGNYVEAKAGVCGMQQLKRALVRPQPKHAAGYESTTLSPADASAHLPQEEARDGKRAAKHRVLLKGHAGSSGAKATVVVPVHRRGAGSDAGAVRRRVRKAGSSSSSSDAEEEETDKLAVAVAALEKDEDEDEYVPSSWRNTSSSPQPRQKLQRRAVSDADVPPKQPTVAQHAGAASAADVMRLDCAKSQSKGRSKSDGKSESASKHRGEEENGSKQQGAVPLDGIAAVEVETSGSSAAAKRKRSMAGMVVSSAQRGIEGGGGVDLDEHGLERRQSRRANIGSKPVEFWLTGKEDGDEDHEESVLPHVNAAAGTRSGNGRGQGRGQGRAGRADSVLLSGSSLLFNAP